MSQPNIIFILTDQQRHDTCGCYGQELNITPNLNNLAKKGVIFENAFTNQPVCGPARSIIQTGRYATETKCYRNGIALQLNEKTIARYLSAKGYDVAYIGKWHLASTIGRSKEEKLEKANYMRDPVPLDRRGGFNDYWLVSDTLEFTSHAYDGHLFDQHMNKVEFEGYRVDCLTDFVLEYLDSRNSTKPYFLFISYLEPHQQNDRNAIEGPTGSKEKFKNYSIPGDLQDTGGDWREFYPDYLGCCHSIDQNLGRILNKLERLGIMDNTIIIFTSDHGCHFRTRNSEYKRSCHESSIRIPLVIKGPGFLEGKRISKLVSHINLPPTLLESAGVAIPDQMRGKPLQRLIEGNSENWPQEVFIQISESQVGRALRTSKWKYSVRAPKRDGILYSKSDLYFDDFLYDLENDPYERNNLVNHPDFADIRMKLASILKEKMTKVGEENPEILHEHF